MKISYPPAAQSSFSLLDVMREGFKRGIATFWMLAKVMIPVFIAVYLLRQTPVFDRVAGFFRPYMGILGLPGDAALAVIVGSLVNLYSAVAVLAPLELSWQQVTVAAIFLGVSHSHPMEAAIMYKMKTRFLTLVFLRLAVGFLLAWGMKLVLL
ncbi:MAG TPA: nucleoside recognition domain-containing protein [Verrucomicrobiae bacterium]|nr:nucleoside recognition domain-containing protein [Verrucomicrobiae bacterium]